MALTTPSYDGSYSCGPLVAAVELVTAIENKLLSVAEARKIYYNQFPLLAHEADAAARVERFTPPALD